MRKLLVVSALAALFLVPVGASVAAPPAKPTTTTSPTTTTTAPPTGIAGYEIVTGSVHIDANSGSGSADGAADAQCPTGKVPLGGGFEHNATFDQVKITASRPVDPNWWRASFRAQGPFDEFTVTAYAICANG